MAKMIFYTSLLCLLALNVMSGAVGTRSMREEFLDQQLREKAGVPNVGTRDLVGSAGSPAGSGSDGTPRTHNTFAKDHSGDAPAGASETIPELTSEIGTQIGTAVGGPIGKWIGNAVGDVITGIIPGLSRRGNTNVMTLTQPNGQGRVHLAVTPQGAAQPIPGNDLGSLNINITSPNGQTINRGGMKLWILKSGS